MPERLVKVPAGFIEKVHHGLLANLRTQCQCVDEHPHRVADAQVGTPVADGGNANLLIVGET